MRPLYSITAEYAATYDALSQMDTLSDEVIKDTLDAVQDEFNNKALNIAAIIKNLKADSAKIKEAAESMLDRRKRLENEAERLSSYLLSGLEAIKLEGRITSPEHEIGLAICPASLKVEDEAALLKVISTNYVRIVPESRELDKNKIKEALNNGTLIEGVSIVKNKRLILK